MELRSIPKDGCHASAEGGQPACEQLTDCPLTGGQAVTTSKSIDYWLIPTLACDICHSLAFPSLFISSHGSSLGERCPGAPVGYLMSCRNQLLAEWVEPISVMGTSAPQSGRRVWARMSAEVSGDGGFAAEGDGWLSR